MNFPDFQTAYMLPDGEDEEDGRQTSSSAAIPDFPKPYAKEYILRNMVPRPAPWSRPSPQRMYCVVIKEDYRLCGAFTADTTFQ